MPGISQASQSVTAGRRAHRQFVGGSNDATPTINGVKNQQQIQIESTQGIVHALQYSLNRMQRRHLMFSVAWRLD
ncbi:hypothetical protein [Burkholderia sp. Ax-1719]|uniref:hypothetical protein n=1 Tax=Burkholderia sp. Ax-1719 TaxID=2608334 RepID=UPI0031F54E0F